jgi:hypothetical protein
MNHRLLPHVKGLFYLFLIIGFQNNLYSQYISIPDALNRPPQHITIVSGSTYEDNTGSFEQTYDARGWKTKSTVIYPVKVGNNTPGTRQVWIGGEVYGQSPLNKTWREMKANYDGAGILMRSIDYLVIDGIRTHNVMDAIRPRRNASTFRVSNVYATYTRDDAVENDEMMAGQIDDCLFDGCYVFLSQQGSQTWSTLDSLEITNTLVRLEPMPYDTNVKGNPPEFQSLYGVNADRHGQLFKHHGTGDAPLIVNNCIFYVPQHSVNGTGSMAFPDFEGCRYSNNILLWTGGGSYPGKLPETGVTEYNLTNSTREQIDHIWESAVNEWLSRHGYDVKPHHLTVVNGSGDGDYIWKTEVIIQADAPADGKVFDKWAGDVKYVADPHSSITTLTMPVLDISLIATYRDVNIEPWPSQNALLGAITWPDAPPFFRECLEWKGDTIPNFSSGIFTYELTVSDCTMNVPALMAMPDDLNARISVKRAKLIKGPLQDRTTTFTVTAEDGITVRYYSVIFSEKKKEFSSDPIITDLFHMRTNNERAIEISNPGNTPIDLSDYMLVAGSASNLEELINGNSELFADRFKRYVPGYAYYPEILWESNPNTILKDDDVDPIIEPGGSFVVARARNSNFFTDTYAIHYDVLITLKSYNLFVDEEATNTKAYYLDDTQHYVTLWRYQGGQLCLLKILNDSIKAGLKPVTDPNDFELVDMVGHWTGDTWNPVGEPITNWQHRMERKPRYWRGNSLPGLSGSFGETEDESEWIFTEIDWTSAAAIMTSGAIGHHSFDPVYDYVSTVSSRVYKVSGGYTTPQHITGVAAGTTVSGFMSNIDKAHEDQSLMVMGKENNDELAEGDTLIVTSADSSSVTRYAISLGSLSSDAVLDAKTGSGYTIDYTGSEGTISGIQFGATIKEVLDNINKPENAIITVLDIGDNLVPLQLRNFNKEYIDTKAGNNICFEVIAEDGATRIIYRLILNSTDRDAWVYSDFYEVDQYLQLVSYVPQGTNVQTLFSYLHPNEGAGVTLVDETGLERILGNVESDDLVIVTSADNSVQAVYFIEFLNESSVSKAYVVSDVLEVDQLQMLISGIPENTVYNIFMELITPARGASVVLLDNQQQPVTSGEIANDYTLKVTSGDGLKAVTYDLSVITSVDQPVFNQMKIYPNPATSRIFIEGVGINCNIVIRNISGQIVKIVDYKEVMSGSVSVGELTPGIYLIYGISRESYSRPVKLIKL